ncbi:MAG: serine/threonine protein kinase [Labilithrix sp.]|nr:serine/threonine protein kinase [Labilithrix sp.]
MSDEARNRSPVKPGDVVGGKYRVDRVLGAGGMGVVVAATHTELDQPVALKFILPEAVSGKDAVERFMREARSVARLRSEHVARVHDVGRDENGHPFMVLELLEGCDLAKLSKQKGPFAIADAIEYVLQVCEALVEAHAAGIVHRDLKPQNVFVSRRLNGTPLVKVLDFGIAKAVGAAAVGQMALTDSQAVMGSPLYMAPEHMRSARAADVRSDIWSLGVMLYELLGGQLPFDGETVTEVCIRVVNEPPASLLSLRPGLEEKLVGIVMRCLEKDPAARWQNVAQLAAALEPYSRSALQGVVVRPWRSFEDTMDSRPPAPADDTGPSTAVTMPTGEDIARALGASPAHGVHVGSVASQPPGPQRVASEPARPLVSTDVSWGQGTEPRRDAARRSTFTTGIVVGAAVSLAAAAAVIVGLRSPALSTFVSGASRAPSAEAPAPASAPELPSAAPSSAVVTPAASSEVATPPAAAPDAPAVVADTSDAPPGATVITPASLPTAVPSPNARPRGVGPMRGRTPLAAPPASASAASAPAAPVVTQAPNGAPILR